MSKKISPLTDKMVEDDIINIIHRINLLINYNLALAKYRLAVMSMNINKYMRMYNGNRRLKIFYQNVPGTLSKANMILTIQSLLVRLDPDVLAIAEPTTEDLDIDWSPYNLVQGYIHKGKKVRLNLLIKSDLKYSQSHWNVQLPHAVICLEGWKMIFAYREWAFCGDQATKDSRSQLERWSTFVKRWSREKGSRTLMIGDMNFHYWGSEGSQKSLRPIRDLVLDEIISEGWYQLITQNTRYQSNCTPSCLDQVYSRSTSDIAYVKNYNETGYDHNCVGVQINVSKTILYPQVTEFRNIKD